MDSNPKKKSTRYLLIGILVLFFSILGASVAYYLARVSGNLSGRAAGTELAINVEKLSTNATGDLIPLDNDLETLQLAAAGYQDKGACVDINGYSVCQIYKITVTNNGSIDLKMNGTVTLSGQNVPNIDCAKMDDESTISNNNSCKSGMFVSGDTLAANSHNDYYVMVYISNLDEPQTDSGEFNGTITFTTEDGRKVKGRFTKPFNLVQRIETLYNDAAKTEVINNDITYNYATSVGLMKDRLGGTTTSLEGGNIRYYGGEKDYYIENDGNSDGEEQIANWETFFVGDAPFNDTNGCLEFIENNGGWSDEASSETGYETLEDFCGTSLKYYRNIKNYVDIGDKAEDDQENWNLLFPGYTKSQCESSVASMSDAQLIRLTGMNKEIFCSVTPAGTPILWRIIGIFDGKIRVRRDKPIGFYPVDSSSNDINTGYGINQWGPSGTYQGADLMKLLNPGYEENVDKDHQGNDIVVNNSLWWNSKKGNCYLGGGGNYYSECDFTSSGLSDEAKEYIVNQTLYLGGFDSTSVFANQAWENERRNNVIQNPGDGITRTTTWKGKVGLMYPSDYGYAADFRKCTVNIGDSFEMCTNYNWLNQINYMISPSLINASDVFGIGEDGFLLSKGNESVPTYPTLLLDSSVLAESGNGSKETPYVLTS